MSTSIGANPFSQSALQFGGGNQGASVGGQQASAKQAGGAQGVDGISQAQGASGAGAQNNLLQGMNPAHNPNFPRHDRMFVASA